MGFALEKYPSRRLCLQTGDAGEAEIHPKGGQMKHVMKAVALLLLLGVLMAAVFMPLPVEGKRASYPPGLYPGQMGSSQYGMTCGCPMFPFSCGCYLR